MQYEFTVKRQGTKHSKIVNLPFCASVCLSPTDMNCALMLNARGAETICLHMNEADPTGQVLLQSSEVMWNLLERGSREEVTAQLGSMECIMYVGIFIYSKLSNFIQNWRSNRDLLSPFNFAMFLYSVQTDTRCPLFSIQISERSIS